MAEVPEPSLLEVRDTRRAMLVKLLAAAALFPLVPVALRKPSLPMPERLDPWAEVYRAVGGAPAENLRKVVGLMGGIEKLIGLDDVVVIKPNLQWWNQGAPNLAAVKAFVDLVMHRPGGFDGEIAIAENIHYSTPRSQSHSGWAATFVRNADLDGVKNMNGLAAVLQATYGDRVTVTAWDDVVRGAKRVYSPRDGVGYVYCDGTNDVPLLEVSNGAAGSSYRATIMTYPIFATDRGTIVDLKHGIWESGAYTERPLRFVNFSAINHHSEYCGATSAVKNYLGVSDLSGGPDPADNGRLTGDYFNFHSFPFNMWAPGPTPGMLGAEIGRYLTSVRKADLNITTAEWVGLASRTDPPVARTRAVLASTDPVALDFHAAKYLLFANSGLAVHDPDNHGGPLYQYLAACSREGGGVVDERHVSVRSYDMQRRVFQSSQELAVVAAVSWGVEPKPVLKYFALRYL